MIYPDSYRENIPEIKNKQKNPGSFNWKKLLFLIPIILGVGALLAAAFGGIGLFAHSTPHWLSNAVAIVGKPGNWTFSILFFGGGALGVAGVVWGILGITKNDKIKPSKSAQDKNIEKIIKEKDPQSPVTIQSTSGNNSSQQRLLAIAKKRNSVQNNNLKNISKEKNENPKSLVTIQSTSGNNSSDPTLLEIATLLNGKKYMRGKDDNGNIGILFIDQRGNLRREVDPAQFEKCSAYLKKNGYELYSENTISYTAAKKSSL